MEYLLDKLPELKTCPLKDWSESNYRLDKFDKGSQEFIVGYVIRKLAMAFGGYHHFWSEEKEAEFMMAGWISGLCNLNPKQIFMKLYHVLIGKTEFTKRPPRSPMEFYSIHVDPTHDQTFTCNIPKEIIKSDRDVGAKYISEIRSIIGARGNQ